MYHPTYKAFSKMSEQGNVIPVYREIIADMETPVSALMKLRLCPHLFLLESVEGGEKWGRYTFLGANPHLVFKVCGNDVHILKNGTSQIFPHGGNPLGILKEIMDGYHPVPVYGLPRFYGGAVGFLGYDMVRYFERLPNLKEGEPCTADAVFMVTDTLIIFDNIRHTIKVVACAMTDGMDNLQSVYEETIRKIDAMVALLSPTTNLSDQRLESSSPANLQSNMTAEEFSAMVDKAKEYIVAGDIIQVVLSQRFEGENTIDPLHLYRALRYTNPSPYLFFIRSDNLTLVGSSPEVMVRLEEGIVELKPIAGTKRRGKNEQEDRQNADELLKDPKERAEHVMLVDLGRNDLGRIARIGSVQVNQLMAVERYSHVMHLVSNIQAQLETGKNAFDVLKATFPAGTLTGAPKIRAMEIIEELEPMKRGPYGGAVGYFSFTGNMDFCITIRTMMIKDGKIVVQAGAGIVADSDPAGEHRECLSKAEGLMQAIRLAESGFEITPNGG
jgi:anthranilate synthase component I